MDNIETTFQGGVQRLNELAEVALSARLRAGQLRLRDRPVCVASRDWASNDYLNLSQDQRVVSAGQHAAAKFGAGWTSSRLLSAKSRIDADLETQTRGLLPSHLENWSATFFSSGSAANAAFFDSIAFLQKSASSASLPVEIFVEHRAHSSLIGGIRAAGLAAVTRFFKHGEMRHLARVLSVSKAEVQLVVLESLHSMEGTYPDPEELVRALQSARNAALFLDEAHSFGLFDIGCWCLQKQILSRLQPHLLGIMMGCGKAVGVQGGLLAMPAPLTRIADQAARSLVYTTGPSPFVIGAVQESLQILFGEDGAHLRRDLHRKISMVQSRLERMVGGTGWHLRWAPESPIISLWHQSPMRVSELKAKMIEAGINVAHIRPPTVPRGTDMIRLTVTLSNDNELLLDALEGLMSKEMK